MDQAGPIICPQCGGPIASDDARVWAEPLARCEASGSVREHVVYLPGEPQWFHAVCAPSDDAAYRVLQR